jgi:hypothetical protein
MEGASEGRHMPSYHQGGGWPLIGDNPPLAGGCEYRWLNERRQLHLDLLGFPSHPGATMTVKIDEVEPNIFPHVDDLDARDAGRNVEVFLDVN